MSASARAIRESSDWYELRDRIDALPTTKLKGDCFELLVKFYLMLEPRYATKLKSLWLLNEVPVRTRKRLNLPDTDEGIDLVAETNEGEYWAIQAKYRSDQQQSLTRKELATFTDLTFNICRGFDLALVCTTTDRFSHKLKLHSNQLTFCAGDVWRNLDSEFFVRLHALLDNELTLPKPYSPFKHQERAIENAKKHYLKNGESRGKMIMPCGTGKSLTAFWIAQELGAKRTLIAVPSLALIKQTLDVWSREHLANDIDVHWIAVCSDRSVGDVNSDDTIQSAQDLGVDVQTDPVKIAGWLAREGAERKVVFTTYQSGPAIAEAARKANFEFDFLVLDEAHRTVGKRTALFSHLLFDENLKAKMRLAMTATERRYSGRSDSIIGMDSVALYGTTFELLSFNAALEAEPPILSDYRIVTIYVTREEIDELIERNLFVKPDKGAWSREIEAQMLSALVALRKAMRDYPIQHAISFHSTIAKASAFAKNQDIFTDTFGDFGGLDTFHVSGRTKTAVRSQTMREFEQSSRALISNARCLSEGVDVPDIDCVLFADPKRSVVDIVQATGRALRPSDDGAISYIVIPVEIGNLDDEIELQESVFGSVLTILRALASNDERIIEYFRTVASGRPWVGGNIPFEIVVPGSAEIDVEAFVRSIKLHCWSKLARLSWRPFEQARRFARDLQLASVQEWNDYCSKGMKGLPKKPPDIPATPWTVYEGTGWVSFFDWLDLDRQVGNWRPYKDASTFVRQLGLKSKKDWYEYVAGHMPDLPKKPVDIPTTPSQVYKGVGWKGFSDWLRTGRGPLGRDFLPYEQAREFARGLGLSSVADWQAYSAGRISGLDPRPTNIPSTPNLTYANRGWKNWNDWLGTNNPSSRFKGRRLRSFGEARDFARSLELSSLQEWDRFARGKLLGKGTKPDDIPARPEKAYFGKGWIDTYDWLGKPRTKKFRPFEKARDFAQNLGLSTYTEWRTYLRGELPGYPPHPEDIPRTQAKKIYANDGWISWKDWLGAEREWMSFEEARKFARGLGLDSSTEWHRYCSGHYSKQPTLPPDIPYSPWKVYEGEGWIDWSDWLGSRKD